MHFSIPVLAVLCSAFTTTLSNVVPSTHKWLGQRAELEGRASSGSEKRDGTGNCTNPYLRKEWRALSNDERKQYTDAVLCLREKPTRYPEIEGSKSRFDDFQIVHIDRTFLVHFDALFSLWHRWFTWLYEQALRQECGYKGYQPYWDWTLDANISTSSVFDGSPYSMSGDGDYIANRSTIVSNINIPGERFINYTIPPGTGGGCVTTGPFANITVPFGPILAPLNASLLNNPTNLAYTPHCLRRDLNPTVTKPSLTSNNVEILLNSPNISVFRVTIETGNSNGALSLHGGGHIGTGGDLRDTFTSPGDPIFYLHHAQLDRLWTLWQQRDPATRQYALDGTGTLFNFPPSPEVQLNTTVEIGKLAPGVVLPVRELMNTRGGQFCYDYA